MFEHARRQFQAHELLADLVLELVGFLAAGAIAVKQLDELLVRLLQVLEEADHLLGVRAGVDGRRWFLLLILFRLDAEFGFLGYCCFHRIVGNQVHFGEQQRVDEAGNQFVQTLVAVAPCLVFLQQHSHRAGESCQRDVDSVQAILDALGDLDFAFLVEQVHRPHFAHVHAHRVGGSAQLGLDGGQRGLGFLLRGFVVGIGRSRIVQDHRIGVFGCLFEHLDSHVVDHVDDVFDLLGLDHIVGQVVVDLGIGQPLALLAAFFDQHFQR